MAVQEDRGRFRAGAQHRSRLEQECRARAEIEVHPATGQRIVARGRVGSQVVAGAEGAAIPGEGDGAHGLVLARLPHRAFDADMLIEVQCVQLLRPVQHQMAHRAVV